MTNHPKTAERLPRWEEGTIRLIDILPETSGGPCRLRSGLPVSLAWKDVIFCAGHRTMEIDSPTFEGVLEQMPGEKGGSAFVVEDSLFNAVFPRGQALPLCLAGYNMAFLHQMLGGPWEMPPYLLCLYRLARVFQLGKAGDYTLAELAEYSQPTLDMPWYESGATARLLQGRVVLSELLSQTRLNMLVALSCTRTLPPPISEPWGKAQGWQTMEGGIFRDFD